MKLLIALTFMFLVGCTDADKKILKAEITGEKYTIYISGVNHYKVNDYHIKRGMIYFELGGNKYKSNVWMVKTTKIKG